MGESERALGAEPLLITGQHRQGAGCGNNFAKINRGPLSGPCLRKVTILPTGALSASALVKITAEAWATAAAHPRVGWEYCSDPWTATEIRLSFDQRPFAADVAVCEVFLRTGWSLINVIQRQFVIGGSSTGRGPIYGGQH
jgi:hypothetical protein